MAFSEIIAKDTRVLSTGKKVTCSGVPLFENQKSYTLKLYFTKKDNPTVIDDSFQQLGTLIISAPDHIKRKWKAGEVYVFGLTEIQISARVKGTDKYLKQLWICLNKQYV